MSGVDIFGPINNTLNIENNSINYVSTYNSNEKLYSEEDEERKRKSTLIIIIIFISLLILWYLYVFYNCLTIILFQGNLDCCDSNCCSYNCNSNRKSKKIYPVTYRNPEHNENPPNKIKKVRLKEIPKDNIKCSICWEDMKWYNSKSQLHCKHVFHKQCITEWYNQNKYDYTYTYLKKVGCPLCREEFIV